MRHFLAVLIVAILLVGVAHGAMDTVNANDEEFWQAHSLVYALVTAVTNAGQGEYRVTIHPVATLTGKFDCGLSRDVVLTMIVGEASAIPAPPEAGSKTLMLIRQKDMATAEGTQREYRIPSSLMSFMPEKSACVKVSGIEDKVVSEVAESLRRARIKPDPKPNK